MNGVDVVAYSLCDRLKNKNPFNIYYAIKEMERWGYEKDKDNKVRRGCEPGGRIAWDGKEGDPFLDGTPFEPVDVLGNVYNRLVIFDAQCIHSASEYFGTVKENCRLWQMFFFDTE